MIAVQVKFFGVVRDITPKAALTVHVHEDGAVSDVLEALRSMLGQAFEDRVLSSTGGVKGHVRIFVNGDSVDAQSLAKTKVASNGGAAETILYVIPASAGG